MTSNVKKGVLILECMDEDDPGSEGSVLKGVFDLMEVPSKCVQITTADQLIAGIEKTNFKYVHITTHGSTHQEVFKGWWTKKGTCGIKALSTMQATPNCLAVISTACCSGSKEFGHYITNSLGIKYFVGPRKSPTFYNSMLFAHIFYHKLFVTKGSTPKAFSSYDENYKNPHQFRLYRANR